MSSNVLIRCVLLGGGQCLLLQEPLQDGTRVHNLCCGDGVHCPVSGLRLSGSRPGAQRETNSHHRRWVRMTGCRLTMIMSVLQGALSATPLIFIIPSACFLKLSPGRWYRGENLLASVLVLIGFFVMIIGLIMTGLYPQDCSHGVEMFYCADANVSVTTPSA